MSKSSWIAIAAAFVLSVGVTFAIIKLKAPAPKSIGSPLTSLPSPVPPIPAASEKLYQDEAGFSFKYPSDLTVSDDTPNDDVHYSRLKLKKADGTMLELTIKDTAYNSVDAFNNQELKSAAAAVDLTFGNMPAKQFKTSGRLVTAAVSSKILYQLASLDTGYWQKIHTQIAASFGSPEPAAEAAASDTVYEAEEVVE